MFTNYPNLLVHMDISNRFATSVIIDKFTNLITIILLKNFGLSVIRQNHDTDKFLLLSTNFIYQ